MQPKESDAILVKKRNNSSFGRNFLPFVLQVNNISTQRTETLNRTRSIGAMFKTRTWTKKKLNNSFFRRNFLLSLMQLLKSDGSKKISHWMILKNNRESFIRWCVQKRRMNKKSRKLPFLDVIFSFLWCSTKSVRIWKSFWTKYWLRNRRYFVIKTCVKKGRFGRKLQITPFLDGINSFGWCKLIQNRNALTLCFAEGIARRSRLVRFMI